MPVLSCLLSPPASSDSSYRAATICSVIIILVIEQDWPDMLTINLLEYCIIRTSSFNRIYKEVIDICISTFIIMSIFTEYIIRS